MGCVVRFKNLVFDYSDIDSTLQYFFQLGGLDAVTDYFTEHGFGLPDAVLRWINSFLSDRTQQVAYADELSRTRPLLFGVPQGSVLWPLLYILYTAELEQVVTRHSMRLHQYADDSQLYIHVTVSDTAVAEQCFAACVSEVNHWMRAGRLRLNPAKTEVMWLGSHQQLKNVDVTYIPRLASF